MSRNRVAFDDLSTGDAAPCTWRPLLQVYPRGADHGLYRTRLSHVGQRWVWAAWTQMDGAITAALVVAGIHVTTALGTAELSM